MRYPLPIRIDNENNSPSRVRRPRSGVGPLYSLMIAPSKDEQVRRSAAVQLGLAASLSEDPSALKAKLIENLNHPEAGR
jgi:hypothetical protein